MYHDLDPTLRDTVDSLLEHARSALWPERQAALNSLWRGIAKCERGEHEAAVAALGIALPRGVEPAELVFRVVLTAYLDGLGEAEVTNPDQARLYALSLDRAQAAAAERWFAAHPEHGRPEG